MIDIGETPRIEDCPWLSKEDQSTLDKLYSIYKIWNKDAVPLEEVDDSLEYDLIYIPDSGVANSFLGALVKNLGSLELWKPVVIDVNVDISIVKDKGYKDHNPVGFWNDRTGFAGFALVMNYGKSWRLHPRFQKLQKE